MFPVWGCSGVAAIFSAAPGAPTLQERIARGQPRIFFAHPADAEDFFDACPDTASALACGLVFLCQLPIRALS